MKLHVAAFLALLLAAFLCEGGSAPRPDPRWLCESLRCPPIVSPVCGVDDTGELRTFRTACHMELALCHEKKYFVMLKPGEC
ncbi:agrin-like [Schistocerca piceifrons]|uniref:agrin-like n=1 Tax=Schistocerca piceifrons TaxID=274613 RepID=UPI001F5F4102|nr:agrin-like [Schistocerca piceifrons]XP_049939271.1 agrin-like [Schistocerca serialis cubense]